MKRVSNKGCGKYTAERIPFQGSNLFAEDHPNLYVVYSYGKHFPMYVYDKEVNQWFGNKDKYSPSTTRQQSQAYPQGVTTIHYMSTNDLCSLSMMGYTTFTRIRMGVTNDNIKQAA